MKHLNCLSHLLVMAILVVSARSSFAVVKDVEGGQGEFERSVQSVVRNKHYYRAGKLELSANWGFFPYDLSVNHTGFGGRLTWHLSDHFGWEIIDARFLGGDVTSFITSLVSDTNKRIQRLETVKVKSILGTNFLLSPFYGKIRFFGEQVLYFDIYVPIGVGFSSTETSRFSNSGTSYTSSVVATGSDLTLTMGLGIKLYLNDWFGLVVDLRNYMTNSQSYDAKSFKSNFIASFGVAMFVPPF